MLRMHSSQFFPSDSFLDWLLRQLSHIKTFLTSSPSPTPPAGSSSTRTAPATTGTSSGTSRAKAQPKASTNACTTRSQRNRVGAPGRVTRQAPPVMPSSCLSGGRDAGTGIPSTASSTSESSFIAWSTPEKLEGGLTGTDIETFLAKHNLSIEPWQLEMLKKKRPAKMVYYPWKHQGWFENNLVIIDDVETPMAVNTTFYNAIAKEFGVDPEKIKNAMISLKPNTTPTIMLTIELTASQTNALHWIDEAGD